MSIVYKPIDIIKYKDNNNSNNVTYIVVAGFDATLHVYELDSSGIIIIIIIIIAYIYRLIVTIIIIINCNFYYYYYYYYY